MLSMKDILNIGGEADIDLGTAQGQEPVLQSRLKYGTGMRINAALKILAEKREKRQKRKQDVCKPSATLYILLAILPAQSAIRYIAPFRFSPAQGPAFRIRV